MRNYSNVIVAYSIMLVLIMLVGVLQSWSIALTILNYCLISAVMTIGANIQWGYAGLINFGIMGYTALGGLAVVLVSVDPIQKAWKAGGLNILICFWIIVVIVVLVRYLLKHFKKSKYRTYGISFVIIGGILLLRSTAIFWFEASEYVDREKAALFEIDLMEKKVQEGFELLNIAPGGGLGGATLEWTKNKVEASAKKYEFKR